VGLPLYSSDDNKRELEIRNAAIQFLAVQYLVGEWKPDTKLTLQLILELQRLVINQIYTCAGSFRDGPVWLSDGKHLPPDYAEVPALVAEMCEYINDNWDRTAIHLASYLMWRVNWIHPFFGGNGRTARGVAYLILCAKLGFLLPGTTTIPDRIVSDRKPYYAALHDADSAWARGELNVSQMEDMMSSLLAKQLYEVHEKATGISLIEK
jgi:Fic family protein